MTSTHRALHPLAFPPSPNLLRELGCAYVFWLMFLLVLEPGNLQRAGQHGQPLEFFSEVIRITFAALLGTSVTPLLQMLTRRFPVLGPLRRRHLPIHAACIAALALALIVVSCVLAAWIFEGRWLPTPEQVHDQFVGNFSLLLAVLAAYTALVHVVHLYRRAAAAPTVQVRTEAPAQVATPQYLAQVEVKLRGRISFLDLSDVGWIETQGNYLALHAGCEVHLIRETMQKFEARLDPDRFVRIHRRMIVAVERIVDIEPVTNGDALLHLGPGCALRASRAYRAVISQRWRGRAAGAVTHDPG